MTKAKNYIPDGFNTVTPYLIVDGADELIEFITKGLGGEQVFMQRTNDNSRVSHATVKIGNSMIMIADKTPDMDKPELAMLYLYVKDVDALYEKAIKAKGQSIQPPKDQFYGDRSAALKDRWGNTWWIATQKEEVDAAELERRTRQEMERREKQPVD
jgi:uncharacterized glyoxalase superfamily protein PhnB